MEDYDSWEGELVTRKQAVAEIHDHGHETDDFDNDVKAGKDGLYNAQDVLDWLGY